LGFKVKGRTIRTMQQARPVRFKLPYRWGLEAHASRDHTLAGPLWEGCRKSRNCSRDTYPELYITKYTSIRILR